MIVQAGTNEQTFGLLPGHKRDMARYADISSLEKIGAGIYLQT
jgi:hypothetical protein